MYVVKTVNLEK